MKTQKGLTQLASEDYKMKLTQEEGRMIVYGDHKDWEAVKGTKQITEHTRWSICYEGVFLHKPTGKHYELYWSIGATEQQDEQPFEYDDPTPIEVEKKTVEVEKWVPVLGKQEE